MTLKNLWNEVNLLHDKHFPNHSLAPILGNGCRNNPKIMFVFINPTKRNISTNKNWKGPRYPFIGTKQVWRIFHRSGFISDEILNHIETKEWTVEFSNEVLNFLKKEKIYLTNIVKWAGYDATLPDSKMIQLFLPILEKEIKLIKPKYIVTFGLIPFNYLTKKNIKLFDYYDSFKKDGLSLFFNFNKTKIIPCYFPVGRGNPKRAVEILKEIKKLD